MMRLGACLLLVAAAWLQDGAPAHLLDEREVRQALTHGPRVSPAPDTTNAVERSLDAARLGQQLFFDPGLSQGGEVACATCHDPARAFTDGKPVAETLARGPRNTPSVLDATFQRWFFWDGRADSLWSQALEPIENPIEMDGDRLSAVRHVAQDPASRAAYEKLFGRMPDLADLPVRARPVDGDAGGTLRAAWGSIPAERRAAIDRAFANLGKCIAAYERQLVTGPAPFDRFVAGLRDGDTAKLAALTPSAQRGFKIFAGRGGCRTCHFGPRFTDGEFHNLGLPVPDGGHPRDAGRWAGTEAVLANPFHALSEFSDDTTGTRALTLRTLKRDPENWGAFKTPSLRNVARTAPYGHAGQFAALGEVVHFYSTLEGAVDADHHGETVLSTFGLGVGDAEDLVAFLESLTGTDPPAQWLGPAGAED